MASTRAQQAQLIRSDVFLDQVQGALINAAVQVMNEAKTTANHGVRIQWANAIFQGPTTQTAFFIPAMLTNPTIAGAAGGVVLPSGTPCADGDVDYVVASLFDVYAKQYVAQQNYGAVLALGT